MKRERPLDYEKYYYALGKKFHLDSSIIKKAHETQKLRQQYPQKMGKFNVIGWHTNSKFNYDDPIFLFNPNTVWSWRTEDVKEDKYNALSKGLLSEPLKIRATNFSTKLPRVYFSMPDEDKDDGKYGYIWMDEGHNRVAWFKNNKKPAIPVNIFYESNVPKIGTKIKQADIQYGKPEDIPEFMIPKYIDPIKIGLDSIDIEAELKKIAMVGGKSRVKRTKSKKKSTRKKRTLKRSPKRSRKKRSLKRSPKCSRKKRSLKRSPKRSLKRTRRKKTRK